MRTAACLDVPPRDARAPRRRAAHPDDVRVDARGVRLGALRRRRARRRRDEPHRRRPARRTSDPSCTACSSSRRRRPTSGSRLAARADRRLALPRHRHRDDRRARRRLPRARRPRRARARRARTSRSTPASASRRRSRRAPRPTSPTASSSARARSRSPRRARTRSARLRRAASAQHSTGRVSEDAAAAASFVRPRIQRSLLEGRPARSRLRRHGRPPAARLAGAVAPGPHRPHVRRCSRPALSLAIPILIRHAIDNSIAPVDGTGAALWPYLVAVVVLVGRSASGRTSRAATRPRASASASRRGCASCSTSAYLRFPRAFYDQHATGQVVSRATNDLYPIRYFIGWGMVQGAQSLMMIVGVAVVLVLVNPKLALYALRRDAARRPARVGVRAHGDAGLARSCSSSRPT